MSPNVQSRSHISRPAGRAAARPGPHLNTLRHGLRSGHVLLPGDDIPAFRTLRHRLFHLHQPRTIAEARCVETLAVNEWRIARCRLEQTFFKHHLGAAMSGHPDATGYLCNPDLHRLHHRGTDCNLEERRLEKSTSQAESALKAMQRQRTENLTPWRAAALEDYTVVLAEGEPAVEEETSETPMTAADMAPAETSATSYADGGILIGTKRTPSAPARRFPKHWSRRQREAAAQQEAQARRGRAR